MTRWAWGLWLVIIIVSFGVFEGLAIYTGTPTLSQTVWSASEAFPLLPFLFGLLCGGLGVHFFWTSKDSKNG